MIHYKIVCRSMFDRDPITFLGHSIKGNLGSTGTYLRVLTKNFVNKMIRFV